MLNPEQENESATIWKINEIHLLFLFVRKLLIAPICDHTLNHLDSRGYKGVLFSVSGTLMSEGANQIRGSLTR